MKYNDDSDNPNDWSPEFKAFCLDCTRQFENNPNEEDTKLAIRAELIEMLDESINKKDKFELDYRRFKRHILRSY